MLKVKNLFLGEDQRVKEVCNSTLSKRPEDCQRTKTNPSEKQKG